MFGKINDLFDRNVVDDDLERNLPIYKKIRLFTGLTTLMLILLIVIGGFNLFLANKPKEIQPFLYKQTIQRNKEVAVDKYPSLSEEKVKMYVKNVMYDLFTSDFNNIESRLKGHKKYFTENAWRDFETLMNESFIPYVVEKKLLQDLVILEDPILAQSMEDANGKKMWIYEFKAMLRFSGSFKNESKVKNNSKINYVNIIISLKEANVKSSPLGVLIDGLYVKKYARRN